MFTQPMANKPWPGLRHRLRGVPWLPRWRFLNLQLPFDLDLNFSLHLVLHFRLEPSLLFRLLQLHIRHAHPRLIQLLPHHRQRQHQLHWSDSYGDGNPSAPMVTGASGGVGGHGIRACATA